MIELPESHTLSKQLGECLAGCRVDRVLAAQAPHRFAFYEGDPADYDGRLRGRRLLEVCPHGGQVELAFEGGLLLILNDGVAPRLLEAGAARPKKHQLLLAFEDGRALVCTVQMYGGLRLVQAGEDQNPYALVARQKPSPLSEDFSADHFDGLRRELTPTMSAKAFLATEQRIPGLGNGCLQDILFAAGVHPQSKVSRLADGEFEALFHSVRRLLAEMTAQGGRDTERDLYGNPGGYATRLSAKTLPYPCPVCGGPLTKRAFLGGSIYFCATCQPLIQ
ncbi:MAG: endonuclease VIII [Clostridiales bacterium]|nr:endonuclease VIII [Clostridiales bacterium]